MKKIMIALVMMITVMKTTAFANEIIVKQEVLNLFKIEYSSAKDVNWTVGDNYYKASFTMNDQKLFVFYSIDGEFLALTRYVSSLQLPDNIQNSLRKQFKEKWVTDLFEVVNGEGTMYYATLENADIKIILKSGTGYWTLYRKDEK
jgi:hypothetical protein